MSKLSRPIVDAYWLGYVQSKDYGGDAMDLSDIVSNTPVNVVKVAFYNLYPNNGISVCYGMSQNHGWNYTSQGIKTLQASGIKVLASLNSTPQPPVGWNDIQDPDTFANNVKALLIDNLGFDGIDIDNECNETPNKNFENVILSLRKALGSDYYLTYVSYLPERDLPWLSNVGSCFDWITTMAYWLNTQDQISLWEKYSNLLGPDNVLVGVSSDQTSLDTVTGLCQWINDYGVDNIGGIMLWSLSTSQSQQYYNTIKSTLTVWQPPSPDSNSKSISNDQSSQSSTKKDTSSSWSNVCGIN